MKLPQPESSEWGSHVVKKKANTSTQWWICTLNQQWVEMVTAPFTTYCKDAEVDSISQSIIQLSYYPFFSENSYLYMTVWMNVSNSCVSALYSLALIFNKLLAASVIQQIRQLFPVCSNVVINKKVSSHHKTICTFCTTNNKFRYMHFI